MPIRVQFWYSEHVVYFCKQTDNVLRGMDLAMKTDDLLASSFQESAMVSVWTHEGCVDPISTKLIKLRSEWQRPAWSCRTTDLHCCVDYHVRGSSAGQDWRHLDGCSTSRRHFLGGWTSLALPYPGRSRICNVRSLPGCCDLWDLEKQWIDARNECQLWTSEAGKGFKCIQRLYWGKLFL